MKYIGKNGKEFNIECVKNNNFYEVKAIGENFDVMGYANFIFCPTDKKVWLYKIETKERYQGQGVGQAVLDIMECVIVSKRYNKIDGKFFPTNEHARPFYEKNGYTIEKDGYETYVGKVLCAESVIQRVQKNLSNFAVIDEQQKDDGRDA